MKKLLFAIASAAALMLSQMANAAETAGDGFAFLGHVVSSNSATNPAPSGTSCTMVAGSTDVAGECSATATSGVAVTFGKVFTTRPFCTITDSVTATGINLASGPTTTGFTLGTTASGDKIRWTCLGQQGN
jgi:hypothetical protein